MIDVLGPGIVKFLETIVRILIYILIIIGVWLAVSPLITPFRIKKKYNFKTIERDKNKLFRHIDMLITINYNTKSTFLSTMFYVITLAIFVVTFIILRNAGHAAAQTIAISLIASTLPYIFLRTRLHSIRVESSYEAEAVVSEIINQYKINHENMIEAIHRSMPKLQKQKWTSKALFRLATDISGYKNKEELEEAILAFTYSIDTQWSIELGNNIYLAIEYGDDVKESLEDILDELKDLNRINEKNKQINNESFLMIKFIAPLSYAFTVFIIFKNFHFTLAKFYDYQVKNSLGFKFLLLSVASVIVNYIVYRLVKKPKNDF